MLTDPTLTLAEQLFWIVDCFCKTLAPEACRRRTGAVGVAIWTRVRRFERRFSALYAQWKAGTLPVARVRAAAHPPPRPSRGEGEGVALADLNAMHTRPASLLPRAFAWMYKVLPMSAGTLGGRLESLLLNCPEARAFVAAVPRAGRILRPMCTMAGVKPPEWLKLPRRRVSGAYPPPQPYPSRGEGEDTSPRLVRSAAQSPQGGEGEARRRRTPREMALAAMERARRTGKPIDPRKLGSVAYGYVLHWPRDGNCPPPEVGYAPARWRVPKDYRPPKEGD